jgi:hypothetical protein
MKCEISASRSRHHDYFTGHDVVQYDTNVPVSEEYSLHDYFTGRDVVQYDTGFRGIQSWRNSRRFSSPRMKQVLNI